MRRWKPNPAELTDSERAEIQERVNKDIGRDLEGLVPIWEKEKKKQIYGFCRPMRKNLFIYFSEYPNREVYVGQDRVPLDDGSSRKPTFQGYSAPVRSEEVSHDLTQDAATKEKNDTLVTEKNGHSDNTSVFELNSSTKRIVDTEFEVGGAAENEAEFISTANAIECKSEMGSAAKEDDVLAEKDLKEV